MTFRDNCFLFCVAGLASLRYIAVVLSFTENRILQLQGEEEGGNYGTAYFG
jgi:hypothetical protein